MAIQCIQISDLHLFARNRVVDGRMVDTVSRFEACMSTIFQRHENLDFLLVSGDLVNSGDPEGYMYFKNYIQENLSIPVYLCLGNHDNRENFNKVFLDKDSLEPYYYRALAAGGQLELIVLDSGPTAPKGILDEEQLQWLNTIPYTDLPTVIMVHHPLFPWPALDFYEYRLSNAPALYETLARRNVAAILSGHVHSPYSYFFHGIPCYTASAVSFGAEFTWDHKLQPTNDTGYNHIVIGDGQVAVRFYGL